MNKFIGYLCMALLLLIFLSSCQERSSMDCLQSENNTMVEAYEYTYPDDLALAARKNAEILVEKLGIYKELAVLNALKLEAFDVKEIKDLDMATVEGGLHYIQIKDSDGREYCLSVSERGTLWAIYEGDMHGDLIWHVVF